MVNKSLYLKPRGSQGSVRALPSISTKSIRSNRYTQQTGTIRINVQTWTGDKLPFYFGDCYILGALRHTGGHSGSKSHGSLSRTSWRAPCAVILLSVLLFTLYVFFTSHSSKAVSERIELSFLNFYLIYLFNC